MRYRKKNPMFIKEDGDLILFNEIMKHPVLDDEETNSLILSAQKGDKVALQKVIRHNLRLLCNPAKFYSKNFSGNIFDYLSSGVIGLYDAISNFNPKFGKFSTYSGYWIKRAMRNYCYQEKVPIIVIPKGLFLSLPKHKNNLKNNHDLEDIQKKHGKLRGKTIFSALMTKRVLINNHDYKYDSNIFGIEEEYQQELKKKIKDILEKLGREDRFIIVSRIGLKGRPLTLNEVAKPLNPKITIEAVRQKEKRILRDICNLLGIDVPKHLLRTQKK